MRLAHELIPLAIIGCGGHGIHHAEAALQTGDFKLVAAYDNDLAAMRNLAKRFARDIYCAPSLTDLLLRRNIGTVVIASPDQHHYDQLMAALRTDTPPVPVSLPAPPRRKLHVLIDKPVAADPHHVDSAIRAIKEARARGQIVTGCHPRRFDPPYVWVKVNLAKLVRQYGPLRQIWLDFTYGAPQAGWKKNERSLLLDHFSHELDILRFWLGDLPFRAVPGIFDKPDMYYTTVGFAMLDGTWVNATCSGTRKDPERRFDETIKLMFDEATITIDTIPGTVKIEQKGKAPAILPERYATDHNGRLAGVMKAFADAIKGGKEYLMLADLELNTRAPAELTAGNTVGYKL